MLPLLFTGQVSTGLLTAAGGPEVGLAERVLSDLTLLLATLAAITAGNTQAL